MPADVSVVLVNFNSGAFLAGALDSLSPTRQAGLAAEIVVVENASPADQSRYLADAEARGARVLRLAHNTGYAGGCNRGAAATSGRFLFLLNADVLADPEALPSLVRYLAEHAEVGWVEPRCFVDEGRVWQQPHFSPLTPRELLSAALGRLSGRFARRRSLRALRAQLPGWQARSACERDGLSGAFLATRREVFERLGGFDEAYPLAYEDSDLFRRTRAAGWKLALVPEATAIHYAHRSRLTVMDESLAKDRIGRRRFLATHYGRGALWLDHSLAWIEARGRRLHGARPLERFVDLGSVSSPPELVLDGPPGPFVMQLALEPFFNLAAGQIGAGASYRFSAATWRSLLPTTLYLRAFALPDLSPRGAWAVRRAEALDGGAG